MPRRMMTEAAGAPPADEGTSRATMLGALVVRRVTVSWGKELYSPVKYESYEVGPFSLEVEIREGEDVEAALDRAHDFLAAYAEKVKARKRAAFAASLTRRAKD